MQTKMEAKIGKRNIYIFKNLLKQEKLTTRVDDLEGENFQQDEEIIHLKTKISNLESLLPSKLASNNATNLSYYKNNGQSSRVLSKPPTSCLN